MQQLLDTWQGLDARRRLIVMLAAAAAFATVLGLARLAAAPNLALLYSGLDAADAGEVVAALEQTGVSFQVRGSAIYVDTRRRDELRMVLAAQGLPALSGQGYELLDSLSGFGTTAQMFDAAYWRAKEGELARTISASPSVRSARVHIANAVNSGFRRAISPTASVIVMGAAGPVAPAQARALKYLVASAVAGMNPADVSVIDGQGGVIIAADDSDTSGGAQNQAAELKQKAERILTATVGPGRAIVEVSVDTVTESESITERRFDPDSRVAISTDTQEISGNATGNQGGGVTVASNLPEGDAAGNQGSTSSQNNETRERVNFEVSETRREILRSPGAVKRITTAVLVDWAREIDPETGQEVAAPRSDEELGALQELVAGAVGFDEARGDVLTLRALQFDPPGPQADAVVPSFWKELNLDVMRLIQVGILALVSLVLGLFVLRPIFLSGAQPATGRAAPIGLPRPATTTPAIATEGPPATEAERPVLTGEVSHPELPQSSTAQIASNQFAGSQSSGVQSSGVQVRNGEDPAQRLRRLIDERREETVEILGNWIEENESA